MPVDCGSGGIDQDQSMIIGDLGDLGILGDRVKLGKLVKLGKVGKLEDLD